MAGIDEGPLSGVREGLQEFGHRLCGLFSQIGGQFCIRADPDEGSSQDDGGAPEGGLPGVGNVVPYNPKKDIEDFLRRLDKGMVLLNGTRLSRNGKEPIELLSGGTLPADRVREVMVTLQLADMVARRPDSGSNHTFRSVHLQDRYIPLLDGKSPLRILHDIANAGGSVALGTLGLADVDLLTRWGFGEVLPGGLEFSPVNPPLGLPIPALRKPQFVLNQDVLAVVSSAVVKGGGGEECALRNPEQVEWREKEKFLSCKAEVESEIAEQMRKLSPNEFLREDPNYSVRNQDGSNALRLSKSGSELVKLRPFISVISEERLGPVIGAYSEEEIQKIQNRFGPLSERLPADEIRSITLRLQLLQWTEGGGGGAESQDRSSFREVGYYLGELVDFVREGTPLKRSCALFLEAVGIGFAFYRGSSGKDAEVDFQLNKGVVEVLLTSVQLVRVGPGDCSWIMRSPEAELKP